MIVFKCKKIFDKTFFLTDKCLTNICPAAMFVDHRLKKHWLDQYWLDEHWSDLQPLVNRYQSVKHLLDKCQLDKCQLDKRLLDKCRFDKCLSDKRRLDKTCVFAKSLTFKLRDNFMDEGRDALGI